MPPLKTLVINNFGGRLTRLQNGDMNSGLANLTNTWGNDPFSSPGQLTWQELTTQIDSGASVITDLIMCGKERVESGISYVYCVGHTGRVYKIQVNNPATFNPNYDNPVLLTTLTINSPTFTNGGFIEFFGSTERLYVGHDKGVTYVNFDGTSETFVGVLGSWTQTVPRPLRRFGQYLYAGNGANIAQILDPSTVATYTQLSPGFFSNTFVRDMEISPDGNYIVIVVSRLALSDQTSAAQDTNIITNTESYTFRWNGSDLAASSYNIFPSYSLTANKVFGNYEYNFGYDLTGGAVFNPVEKILTPKFSQSPSPNAVASDGSIVTWVVSEFANNVLRLALYLYGAFDSEVGTGWWKVLTQGAMGTETDVIRSPFSLFVSNFGKGSSKNGYTNNLYSVGKLYFSTLEASSGTTKYKLYKFYIASAGLNNPVLGVYQTQTQLFSKKIKVSEVRVYGQPWVANNGFKIDLIGSAQTAIANSSYTFTAGSTLTVGDDRAKYTPQGKETYALGVSITNTGTANFTINKVEIDYVETGGS